MGNGADVAGDMHPLTVFCFLVNSCIGVGFLSLPYTYSRAGVLWGSALTTCVVCVAMCTAAWVVHAMSNTEALLRRFVILHARSAADAEQGSIAPCRRSCLVLEEHTYQPLRLETPRLLTVQPTRRQRLSVPSTYGSVATPSPDVPDFHISCEANEWSHMLGLLFPSWVRTVYVAVLSALTCASLWCFASVFASSMAVEIPLPTFVASASTCDVYSDRSWGCRSVYIGHLVLFASVVVPLSLIDIKEQRVFQVVMAGARFILILVLIGDAIRLVINGQSPAAAGITAAAVAPHPGHVTLMESAASRLVIGVSVFALLLHHIIPTATADLRAKKQNLLPTVWSALAFCGFVYVGVGVATAAAFGADTLPVASLNWRHVVHPVFGTLIANFLIVFPPFDVVSAYPLLAICLAENLQEVLFTSARAEPGRSPAADTDRVATRRIMRVCAALPPIIGAAFVDNISPVLEWGSICTYVLLVVFPLALMLRSSSMVSTEFGPHAVAASPYATRLSRPAVVVAVLLVSATLYCVHSFGLARHLLQSAHAEQVPA